jgi:hypothetical protein
VNVPAAEDFGRSIAETPPVPMDAVFEPIAADPSCEFCSGRRQAALLDVGAAYCISLVEQPQRAAYAAAHFHAIGLCQQVIFLRAHRAAKSKHAFGIWQSHRAVAREALRVDHGG